MHDSVTADMFEPPIARKRDPVTSKIAAVKHSISNRGVDQKLVLETIRNHPHCTANEYSRILKNQGVDWLKAARMTTKRISDLVAKELVGVGPSRTCEKTGERAQTYYVKSEFL